MRLVKRLYCGYMAFMAKNLKKAKSFRFSDSELELLDALKERHGSYAAGIVAAAHTELGRNDITKADVKAWIDRNIPD